MSMLVFQFIADAFKVSHKQGKAKWDQAKSRLGRVNLKLPATTSVQPPGARHGTPALNANDAAKALSMVIKHDPLEDFFGDEQKLAWLRKKVQDAGGDPSTVDAEVARLQAEKAQKEADTQSLIVPGLNNKAVTANFRTYRQGNVLFSGIPEYLRWLEVEDNDGHLWRDWLRAEFHRARSLAPDEVDDEVHYIEKQLPGNSNMTPMTNFAGYRLINKLCLHKSKIAQNQYDKAMTVLGHVAVGDQRLHDVIDANAASSSNEARAFVMGVNEARAQRRPRSSTTTTASAVDLDAMERKCLEDPSINESMAATMLAKIALARQYRDAASQQGALVKRQRIADVEKYEAEKKAEKEAAVEKLQAEKEAAVEKIYADRDQSQVHRATLQAERQKIQDTAKAEQEERERERVHAAELAAERRRQEIRQAATSGSITDAAASEMLAEDRKTPILRFENWIQRVLKCPAPSKCSSVLKKDFNDSVTRGEHVKPTSHRNSITGTWNLYEEHDGTHLTRLHQAIHDRRNGVSQRQPSLSFSG